MGAQVRSSRILQFIICLGLLATLLPLAGAASPHPAASYPPVKATLTGPSVLAVSATGSYVLKASGGPAQLLDGSFVGNYTYNASLIGANTTGGSVSPASGSLTNESTTLKVTAPNNTGTYTLSVNVTSTFRGNSTSTSTGFTFTAVVPYVVSASLVNHNSYTIKGALVQVNLDGTQVAVVTLPSIQANGSYNFVYNYTTTGLSPGDHTFTLTLQGPYGLLQFSQGGNSISSSFYVTPPPVDYTLYYVTGISLVGLAIFISLLIVGGRKRKKSK